MPRRDNRHHAARGRRAAAVTRSAGLGVAAAIALLVHATAARAAFTTWGSTMSAAASVVQAFQQDSLFTLTQLGPRGAATPTVAPAPGQIVSVSVKGMALPSTVPGAPPPLNTIHFQDLEPEPGGSYVIDASSQPFALPDTGDPNQVTVFKPENLCVNAGDRVAFNTEGGFDPTFYPNGVGFRVFGSVAGSSTGVFVGHNKTMNGDLVTLAPQPGTELLMQVVEATGRDATPLCPGGSAGMLPPPVLGKTVDVSVVSGTVYVKLPGAHAGRARAARQSGATTSLSKGMGFIPLTQARQVPVGTIFDTTAGVARITTATAAPGHTQLGDFYAGVFELLQSRRQKGLTQMDIVDQRSRRQVCAGSGKKASGARLTRGVLGLLRGNAHGRFTTRGNYSSATVRGTEWTVADKCAGTLTRVTRGVVVVDDFRRHRDVLVPAGRSYLALASH